MADTFTSRLRFQQPTVGGDVGTWGTIYDTTMQCLDDAISGVIGINLSGLSTLTLTASNGTSDQARGAVYNFTGNLTGSCTVTLPPSIKVGWAVNNTTGGFNVIMTTGSGQQLQVAPNGLWSFFYCDGTNIVLPGIGIGTGLTVAGNTLLNGAVQVGSVIPPTNTTISLGVSAGVNTGAIRIYGRASDNVGLLDWYDSAGTTSYAALQSMSGGGLILSTVGVPRMYAYGNGYITIGTNNTEPIGNGIGGWAFQSPSTGQRLDIFSNGSSEPLALGKATTGYVQTFWYNPTSSPSTLVNTGGIVITASTTSYVTTSDYRMKETFGRASGKFIDDIIVHDASMKADPSLRYPMVLAHELQGQAPWAVYGEKDAVNEDGSIKPQQVDYSKLVAALIARVQELSARLADLEGRLTDDGR